MERGEREKGTKCAGIIKPQGPKLQFTQNINYFKVLKNKLSLELYYRSQYIKNLRKRSSQVNKTIELLKTISEHLWYQAFEVKLSILKNFSQKCPIWIGSGSNVNSVLVVNVKMNLSHTSLLTNPQKLENRLQSNLPSHCADSLLVQYKLGRDSGGLVDCPWMPDTTRTGRCAYNSTKDHNTLRTYESNSIRRKHFRKSSQVNKTTELHRTILRASVSLPLALDPLCSGSGEIVSSGPDSSFGYRVISSDLDFWASILSPTNSPDHTKWFKIHNQSLIMNTRDALAIGSDTRPPVLFRGDFSQWKSRFLDFVEKQPFVKDILESLKNGPVKFYMTIPDVPDGNPPVVGGVVEKDATNLTPEEANRLKGDQLSKSYLIQSLPNDIYANIDCNDTGKAMWDEICSLMHDTEKGIQMKRSNLLTKFATFKGREGELLEDTYHRFCTMINELRKNKLKKSQLEINIQFINSLRSEWRRFASNIQHNRNLEDIDIHELYELLHHNQDEVLETMSNMKKVEKYADPLALVADRRQFTSGRSPHYEDEYDVPSDNGEKGSDSDEEMNDMKKALALNHKDFV
ncbi:hypothetical protein OSB04_006097 [Centaurea solstitialis]|uniref:Uncharacterized protein n=1 Tax=Centaurea solstitialis TaxID=347529 RepID=A0AA38U0E1_9ASTR|nr:hypothetical protein OSB04_006097 [Centaurea solstitialis]